jgi:integrase
VALDVADVEEDSDGLRLVVRRSKTDQEGAGLLKGLPRKADPDLCPVRTLAAWLAAGGIEAGPLWRRFDRWGNLTADRLTDQSVALIVKRACRRAGVDPGRYAGHSLRSGFATSAAAAQVAEASIQRQTGHRSAEMVRRYVRHGSVFVDNAASYVNL